MPGFPVHHQPILPSAVPFSSCLQHFPASGSFPMSQLFISSGQSIGALASASVVPMNIRGWFPLGLTGLILQAKGRSRVFSNTTVQKHQFIGAQRGSNHLTQGEKQFSGWETQALPGRSLWHMERQAEGRCSSALATPSNKNQEWALYNTWYPQPLCCAHTPQPYALFIALGENHLESMASATLCETPWKYKHVLERQAESGPKP